MSPLEQISLADVYRRHLERPRGPYDDLANHLTISATLLRGSDGDPVDALGRLEVATSVLALLTEAQATFVAEARQPGGGGRPGRAATWQQIADALGIEKQSAWSRFGRGEAAS